MSASRPPRSPSIPIPARNPGPSTSPRNIESVISLPLTSPSRPRLTGPSPSVVSMSASNLPPRRSSTADDPRSLGLTPGMRGAAGTSFSVSPAALSAGRPPIRPHSISYAGRPPPRVFEPRIVRGPEPVWSIDPACNPVTSSSSVAGPSTSPSRTRRTSGATIPGIRSPSLQRHHPGTVVASTSSSSTPAASSSLNQTNFVTRPAYLEHSALRHMLQTEPPPGLPPSRKMVEHSHISPYSMAPSGNRSYYFGRGASLSDSDDDSTVSPPREIPPHPPIALASQDSMFRLPTRWSDHVKQNMLSVSPDGRDVSSSGVAGSGDKDAAVRTNHPIPPACGIYYYEVEITGKVQKGHEGDPIRICVGFAGPDVKLSRIPGLEPNSWGFYGDDGSVFSGEKTGSNFAQTFTVGDVIGCGIDFTTHRAFYTKNGTLLGSVFDNVGRNTPLYPSVGFRQTGDSLRVNFGHELFRYDIDYHVQQQRNATWAKILTTPLDASLLERSKPGIKQEPQSPPERQITQTDDRTKAVISQLVYSYLTHHGYVKTARGFRGHQAKTEPSSSIPSLFISPPTKLEGDSDIDMDAISRESYVGSSTEDDMDLRTRIVGYVAKGDIDLAISETRKYYPQALTAEDGLMSFKLRCRKFVELILEAAALKKRMKLKGVDPSGALEGNISGSVDPSSAGEGLGITGVGEENMGMDIDEEIIIKEALAPRNGTNGFASTTSIPIRKRPASPEDAPFKDVTDTPFGSTPSISPGPPLARVLSSAREISPPAIIDYENALNRAIAYGQSLSADYKDDPRPEVKTLFKKTFGIVAWDDPLEAGGVAAEVVGDEARVALADELNRTILKSQGKPAVPALELLYRHTAACIVQLGREGVGAAAFADMPREFLDAT